MSVCGVGVSFSTNKPRGKILPQVSVACGGNSVLIMILGLCLGLVSGDAKARVSVVSNVTALSVMLFGELTDAAKRGSKGWN